MKSLLTIFIVLLTHFSWAQEYAKADTLKPAHLIDKLFNTADDVLDQLSGENWTFIPALTYSPETSLGLGLRAIKIIRSEGDPKRRPSTIPITLLYTLNKQIIFTSSLDLWLNGNADHLYGRLELSDYPFKFYGVGNNLSENNAEDYASRSMDLQVSYQKLVVGSLYLGPKYRFNLGDIYKKQIGGMLETGNIAGSEGQRISGLGIGLSFDTRNNIFQPERGVLHQAQLMSYQSFLGSDFIFSQYQLDLRKYVKTYESQVLAVQAWYSLTAGRPPFQQLSLLGGSDIMRGYFEGRYRDRHAMVYQVEYRIPVYRKLGVVLFGSTGQVAGQLSSFTISGFKYGGGLGFRYRLTEDGLNIRLDLAYGDQAAFYFGLNEVL